MNAVSRVSSARAFARKLLELCLMCSGSSVRAFAWRPLVPCLGSTLCNLRALLGRLLGVWSCSACVFLLVGALLPSFLDSSKRLVGASLEPRSFSALARVLRRMLCLCFLPVLHRVSPFSLRLRVQTHASSVSIAAAAGAVACAFRNVHLSIDVRDKIRFFCFLWVEGGGTHLLLALRSFDH